MESVRDLLIHPAAVRVWWCPPLIWKNVKVGPCHSTYFLAGNKNGKWHKAELMRRSQSSYPWWRWRTCASPNWTQKTSCVRWRARTWRRLSGWECWAWGGAKVSSNLVVNSKPHVNPQEWRWSNLLSVITFHKILYVFQIQISHLTLSFDGDPHRFLIDTSGQWNSFLQESIQLLSNRNFFVPPFWQEPGPMKKHCEICATRRQATQMRRGSILVDISSVRHSKTSTSKHWQSNKIHLMCPWYYKKVRKVPHTSRTFQSCILRPASSCAIMRSLRSSKLVEETPEHRSTHEHMLQIRVNTEGFSEIA